MTSMTCSKCGQEPKFKIGRPFEEAVPLRVQTVLRREDGRYAYLGAVLCRSCLGDRPEENAQKFMCDFLEGGGPTPELVS